MSDKPICDSINKRFDAWDKDLDELSTRVKEVTEQATAEAKKRVLEEVKRTGKQIEDYVKQQFEALKGNNPLPEVEISTDIKLDGSIITAVKDLAKSVNKMIKLINKVVIDSAEAIALLPTRASKTLAKVTSITTSATSGAQEGLKS